MPKPYIIRSTDNYTIESFVWRPGQKTSIHNHKCLCVAGVMQGLEIETRYKLKGQYVVPEVITRMESGQISVLKTEDIHSVQNEGPDVAISLHVYAADIMKVETSIDNVYEMEL